MTCEGEERERGAHIQGRIGWICGAQIACKARERRETGGRAVAHALEQQAECDEQWRSRVEAVGKVACRGIVKVYRTDRQRKFRALGCWIGLPRAGGAREREHRTGNCSRRWCKHGVARTRSVL